MILILGLISVFVIGTNHPLIALLLFAILMIYATYTSNK